MTSVKLQFAKLETLHDLKRLLASSGPCLSVYMPLSNASTAGLNPAAKENRLRWRECLRLAERRVDEFGPEARQLLESVSDWDKLTSGAEDPNACAVAVFRSPDAFQVVFLDREVGDDRAVLAPHFYIRPLLPALTRDNAFYLLALSKKDTRLLYCTRHNAEVVALPESTKTNFNEWMNTVKPDHTLVYNGSVGPDSGSSKGAIAPKGADEDAQNAKYFRDYCKQLDRGIGEVLRGKTEPLIVCAVEYEIPVYRDVNTYPHLADEVVHGAANSLKSGEMHARGLEALDRVYDSKISQALGEWNHRVGAGASSRLKDVVTAAHDGRVLTLLVSDSYEKTGVFDEETHSVKGRETGSSNDEDLVNDAAVQTVLHAGNVLLLPHNRMPNGAPVAAIFRF